MLIPGMGVNRFLVVNVVREVDAVMFLFVFSFSFLYNLIKTGDFVSKSVVGANNLNYLNHVIY